MIFTILFQLALIRLSTIFCEISTNVSYTLEDFTHKGKKIGNLVYSATKQYSAFENALLPNDNNMFEIRKNGDLLTKMDLDRDEVCLKLLCCKDASCFISLKAYLFKGPPTIFNIHITIVDTNDNKPNFTNAQTTITIPESAELYSTYKLPVATDADSLKYGIDGYTVSDFTKTFVIVMENNEPSLRLLKSLDREKVSSYNVKLVAYDKGSPQLSSSIDIRVKISDVNDNTPFFVISPSDFTPIVNTSGSNFIKIKENLSGNVIFQLHAHDLDDGDNAKIFYSISTTQSHPADVVKQKFSLKSPYDTAEIQLRQNLDYEKETERIIYLVVVATDFGKPAKSASISLTIHLTDENDNHPVINETTPKDIRENDSRRQQLKILSVRDNDTVSQNKVKCSLLEETKEKFELHMYDWNMYGLFNRVAFDFELSKMEAVRIICLDRGDPEITHSTTFYVNIIDENDNGPIWDNMMYEVNLHENDISHRILLTVKATDADSGYYGTITYKISPELRSNQTELLRIDPATGVINTHRPVDRELYRELIFDITATDHQSSVKPTGDQISHQNTTRLVVKIIDENDNDPRFIGKVKRFAISENCPVSTVVGRLEFFDADQPPNNVLSISLMEYSRHLHNLQRTKWFDIIDNGTIVVKTTLNREELSNISLIVNVEDGGQPPRSSSEDIFIEILDENDNPPVLNYPKNNSFISANGIIQTIPPKTKIVKLEVSDEDLGENSSIKYTIMGSNFSIKQPLTINIKTGEISTDWNTFEAPDIGVYFIQIAIDDRGKPPQTTRALFFVNITSTNTAITAEAYMSNIVILILIIVCSLALIVSLIAAIFWVRFRVTGDSTMGCQEETLEREHLNKDLQTNNYSLMALENNYRQTSFDNGNLNSYDPYSTRSLGHGVYVKTNTLTNDSMNMVEGSRMTPCEDCFNSFGPRVPTINRYESPNVVRYMSPIPPDYNSSFCGNPTSQNVKTLILQGYPVNDFNNISNSHPPNLTGEPNFSDSGKGGSVEDLNYRLPTAMSTFTPAPYNNTGSFVTVPPCQNQYSDLNSKILCTK